MKHAMIGAGVAAILLASPALAQQTDTESTQESQNDATDTEVQPQGGENGQQSGQSGEQAGGDGVTVLSTWSYQPIYHSGISVDRLMSIIDVYGPDGDEIGSVENVIFSDDGQVLSVIAEVGGFWDIGDTHVNIPWDEVRFQENTNRITVPVTEDSVGDYDIFRDVITTEGAEETGAVNDDLASGPDTFKATDLIGDYALLSDRSPYGYVGDLIISAEGQIEAVVVDAATFGTPGYYAYPYDNTYGTSPAEPRLNLPYGSAEIGEIEQFDYDLLRFGNM